jgi:hypothetical protein
LISQCPAAKTFKIEKTPTFKIKTLCTYVTKNKKKKDIEREGFNFIQHCIEILAYCLNKQGCHSVGKNVK